MNINEVYYFKSEFEYGLNRYGSVSVNVRQNSVDGPAHFEVRVRLSSSSYRDDCRDKFYDIKSELPSDGSASLYF